MKHFIEYQDGTKIASFINEHDRDTVLELFRELYPDVEFYKIDE